MIKFQKVIEVGPSKLGLIQGDITKCEVDVIVNAANPSLLGGGGVDGAIHRSAGPKLLEKCRSLNGCKTGEAVLTPGYELKAKWVIHTVGPIYSGAASDSLNLAKCVSNSLKVAEENSLKELVFPAISTGVYAYPKKEASEIMIKAAKNFLSDSNSKFYLAFCLYSDEDYSIFENTLKKCQH